MFDHPLTAFRYITDATLSGRCKYEIPTSSRSPWVPKGRRSIDRHRIQHRGSSRRQTASFGFWKEKKIATSNPRLLRETLGYITDLLHKRTQELPRLKIVGPQTRKHHFSDVQFSFPRTSCTLWKKTFRDPGIPPACHARTLSIACPLAVREAGVDGDYWIRASHIERLTVSSTAKVSPVPFCKFSLSLKSLRVASIFLLLAGF